MKIIRQSLVIVLTLMLCFGVVGIITANELDGYALVAENQFLDLYYNEETAEVAVFDQSTGQYWFTNPVNRSRVETIARGAAKEALSAQVRIVYYAPGDIQRTMDSYNDSVAYSQFEAEPLEGGIRVTYVFGKEWDDKYFLPFIVEVDAYENDFFGQLDAADQRTISGLYALVEVDYPSGDETANLLNDFIIRDVNDTLNARELRTINVVLLDHITANKSNITVAGDITANDIEPFIGKQFYMLKQRDRDMLPWDKTGVIDITRAVGFDPLLIGAGYERFGLDSGQPNQTVFTVPIEYRLDGENLVVSIVTSGIEYPKNILNVDGGRDTYIMTQIDLLPYFGAAETGSDGYMFVPDGSGSLINFDNGKTHLNPYTRRVYGPDHAVTMPSTGIFTFTDSLPVFGIKNVSKALFGIIEAGASIARINADVAGRRISYNTLYPSFHIHERTTSSLQGDMPDVHGATAQWVLGGHDTINIYQPDMYSGEISVRYAFLPKQAASYVGMAHYYQDYLIEKNRISKVDAQENIPFMLEIVGAVPDRLPILGFPRDVVIPLTTYKQALDFIEQLHEQDITNLNVTYNGWLKNGVSHRFPRRVTLEPKLGDRSELIELVNVITDRGGSFYPVVNFQHVKYDTYFDGFRATSDGSRSLARTVAVGTDPVTALPYYILSPRKLDGLVDSFLKSQAEYDFGGIGLADLASRLYGDYRRGRTVIREDAIGIITNQLEKMSDDGLSIQSNGLHGFAIPYVSNVINLPLSHSGIDITDKAVPFMQIVLHGYLDYAGEPFNRVGDQAYLLKMIEVGAYPYFQAFDANSSILKGGLYADYYTGQFSTVYDHMVSVYQQLNEVLAPIQDQRIVNHHEIADNVFVTVYENGHYFIVNYNLESVKIYGVEIDPLDYRVFGGSN